MAPMAGISDHPYRLLTRQFGAAYSITEFVNAIDVLSGHPYLVTQRLAFSDRERPIAIQLFDDQPDRLVLAAKVIASYHPDIIDINMGCSVKKVSNRGAGAGLLREPLKVAKIFSDLSRTINVPITAKIRLGWDYPSRNYLEIARIIEENGGQLIAVHARTRKQGYGGKADWNAIAEIKSRAGIPIVGNGDVKSLNDIGRMFAQTGCDAIMIGRAAIGNPWIFKQVEKQDLELNEIVHIASQHLSMMCTFYGEPVAFQLFRKHAGKYFNPSLLTKEQRKSFYDIQSIDQFVHTIKSTYSADQQT
ncbi:MAG: tRNA-dihydrouridine synthase family protein [Anaerolineae bacterium]|nr:tRNA-dihydrouridine synthase family protein [Anaerolineae bacterium]